MSVDLLRVVRKGGFSYHMFTPTLWRGWLLPIRHFLKKVIHTLYIFLLWILCHVRSGNLLEGSAPFLKVLILQNVSDVFRADSEVIRELLQSFLHELACLYRLISLGLFYFVSRSSTVWPLIWRRFFQDLDHPKVINVIRCSPTFS